jgi:hypothetical protein|tara:strand:- start:84 stop:860 length:777 start_codon:yes stop_codon:yes gene_type:complete
VNSTSNNTNNNNSTIDQNVNSNSTATNTNNNNNNTTSNNTNTNKNESTSKSDSNVNTNNKSESNNTNNNNNRNENINKTDQTIKQEITTKAPPASAIAPSIGSSYSQDLCTTGISGAFQGQVFGISGGKSVRDMNCERMKLSKTIYDMGMKVAAVSLMCQDARVFKAMEMAGTPCPYMGEIGEAASTQWDENVEQRADYKKGWFKKSSKNAKSSAPIDGQVMRSGDEYDAFMKQCRKKKGKGKKKTKSQCEREWESNL